MKRWLTLYVVVCALMIASWQCFAQVKWEIFMAKGQSGCSATLSIDGTPVSTHRGDNNALTYTISTALTNDLIIVIQESHGPNGSPVVSGSTLGTFTQVSTNSGSIAAFWLYYKVATGTLSSEVVTFDASAFTTGSFQSGTVWAIGGASHTGTAATDFDSGGPQFTDSTLDSMTTAFANTALVGLTESGNASYSAGGVGWTVRNNGNFFLSQDMIVSSTGTYTLDNADSHYSNGNLMGAVKRSC